MSTIFKSEKKRRVTQADVARAVKLNRTTVTKILNNDPTYAPNELTRKRVIQKALNMGYKLNAHNAPEKINAYASLSVSVECRIDISYGDGSQHSGSCRTINLSPDGAVVEDLNIPEGVLPLSAEADIYISFAGMESPTSCRLTFIQYSQDERVRGPRVGFEFNNLLPDMRSSITHIMKNPSMN